jgi:hypothetical protein
LLQVLLTGIYMKIGDVVQGCLGYVMINTAW